MKIAILTRPEYRSPGFLAESLARMLGRMKLKADIFRNGIPYLESINIRNDSKRNLANWLRLKWQHRSLDSYQLFILADTLQGFRNRVSLSPLRKSNKPVFLHSVFYLGGSGSHQNTLPGNALEKFDGYLPVSNIHDVSPKVTENVFPIGLDLSLQNPLSDSNFTALIDYPREGYESEREIQYRALQKLGIKTISLDQEYTFEEIENIYRNINITFLAFPEAFGVPICQLQAYGSVIASPHKIWAKRHILSDKKSDVFSEHSTFSENFLFYKDESEIIEKLSALTENFDAKTVRSRFINQQPELYHGNSDMLEAAISYIKVLLN